MKKCVKYQQIIKEYKVDELNPVRRFLVTRHLKECSSCAALFADESQIRDFFSMVPEVRCPDHLAERIAVQTYKKPKLHKASLFSILFDHPKLSFAVAAVSVVFIVLLNFPTESPREIESSFTPEEIAMARKQAQWGLSYAGVIINETEKDVVEDVLLNRFPKTIRKSLEKSLQVF